MYRTNADEMKRVSIYKQVIILVQSQSKESSRLQDNVRSHTTIAYKEVLWVDSPFYREKAGVFISPEGVLPVRLISIMRSVCITKLGTSLKGEM